MFFLLISTYLCTLGVVVTIGILRYGILDFPLKVMFWMLVLCLVSEILSSYINTLIHTKAPVYHIFNILELALICYYFLFVLNKQPSVSVLVLIPTASVALGVGNLLFFQSWRTYNTNVLIAESVLIIGMALYSLYKMMIRDDVLNIVDYPHFRISVAMLILWTGTFFFWAFLSYLKNNSPDYYRIVAMGQSVLNIAVYAFIGHAYYKYKRPLKTTAS